MKAGQRGVGVLQVVGVLAAVAAIALVAVALTLGAKGTSTGQPAAATQSPGSVASATIPAGEVEISIPYDANLFPVNMKPGDRLEVLVSCPDQTTGAAFSNIFVVQEPASAGSGQQQLVVAIPSQIASQVALVIANRSSMSVLRYALQPSGDSTPQAFTCNK